MEGGRDRLGRHRRDSLVPRSEEKVVCRIGKYCRDVLCMDGKGVQEQALKRDAMPMYKSRR